MPKRAKIYEFKNIDQKKYMLMHINVLNKFEPYMYILYCKRRSFIEKKIFEYLLKYSNAIEEHIFENTFSNKLFIFPVFFIEK